MKIHLKQRQWMQQPFYLYVAFQHIVQTSDRRFYAMEHFEIFTERESLHIKEQYPSAQVCLAFQYVKN